MRGIGNDISIGRVKFFIKAHKIDCIVVLEPKIHVSRMAHICRKLGMSKCIANCDDMAHIWIFWRDPLDFSIFTSDEQQITITQTGSVWPQFHLSFVYEKCTILERQALWMSLLSVHSQILGPWLVAGDFNCIMTVDEKIGGNPPNMGAISDFVECASDCALIDAGFIGSQYTWHNNQQGGHGIWA